MKMKNYFLLLCLAVGVLVSFIINIPLMTSIVVAEEMTMEKTVDTQLTTPHNVRVEDGFIIWDEVEGAYGYILRTTVNGTEILQNCYEPQVEINRFFYEKQFSNSNMIIDFGSYDFQVCAFDEVNAATEYSAPITVFYEATFTSPVNVAGYGSSGSIYLQFYSVEGAVRYNIRSFNDDDNRTLEQQLSSDAFGQEIIYTGFSSDDGNYWVSVQAMDGDYRVSEWTEPIAVSVPHTTYERLEAPKNLRLDEIGENILWDAVEGAEKYTVSIAHNILLNNSSVSISSSVYDIIETRYNNWKSLMCPFSVRDTTISVNASGNDKYSNTASITSSLKQQQDKSILVPEELWYEDGYFQWSTVDCTCWWLRIFTNETVLDYTSSRRTNNDGYYIGNKLPAGTYDVELFIVNESGNYNSKKYPITLDTVSDATVWIPKMFYKFDTLLWDWDKLRNPASNFWIRLKNEKSNNIIKLIRSNTEKFYGLKDLSNGEYLVDVCVYQSDKLGNWSAPLHISKHDNGLFDKENESTTDVELPPEAEDIPVEDRITSITINPAFNMKHKNDNNVELDLSKIKIKAKEIYDEDGLKRASEALGETISGNKHYNLMDLTLLYKEENFSNDYEGLVQVIIPLPKGHRDKTFSCYRLTEVNGKMTKEVIPGEQTEDSYIIYLEHFSEYALVADGGEEEYIRGFVNRLYTLVLGREAEEEGLASWTNALVSNNSNGVDAGYGFVFSDECGQKNLSNADFVEMLYNTFMNRASDEVGKTAWVSQLDAGVEREKIFEGFIYSAEFAEICADYGIYVGSTSDVGALENVLSHYRNQNADITKFVARCYTQGLERDYEPDGLEAWCKVIIENSNTPKQVAQNFIFSDEFTQKNLNNEEYVKILYRTFMGREADETGLAAWVEVLESGREDRGKVMEGFSDSVEFDGILQSFGLNE